MTKKLHGLNENQAKTDPYAVDPRLRGRTYAIPFETVWQASVGLAGGGLRGWSIAHTDDQSGVIDVVSTTTVFRLEDDVRVHVGLDYDAQTRVDVEVVSRRPSRNLGRPRRVIGRFMKKLDRRLLARPGQILDPAVSRERREVT